MYHSSKHHYYITQKNGTNPWFYLEHNDENIMLVFTTKDNIIRLPSKIDIQFNKQSFPPTPTHGIHGIL